MIDALKKLGDERHLLRREAMPRAVKPMLATLTHERFSDPSWIFERKLDGERCLAYKDGDSVTLMTRNLKDISDSYPELQNPLAAQHPRHCILDGEIVAFSGKQTSFSRLQNRLGQKRPGQSLIRETPVWFYLFDILHLEGYDTTGLPQRSRKQLLKTTIDFRAHLKFVNHRNGQGERFFNEACSRGWEGLIAKDAGASYASTRTANWLKFKCLNQQELVIGGWTEPAGARSWFGALLVGYYRLGNLVYAGKVGTGFNEETLKDLYHRMVELEQDSSPFTENDPGEAPVHFVEPKLVVEIGFSEWTDHGRLRQPRYLGLRRDKPADQVVREET